MYNWVNALDACAAAGVIDYDAAAFITGQTPRYVGHPQMEQLPLKNDFMLPPGIKLKDVPAFDTYTNLEDKPLVQNPKWKKITFALLTFACLIGTGIGLSKIKKIALPNTGSIKTKLSKLATQVCDSIKKPFYWALQKIKIKA